MKTKLAGITMALGLSAGALGGCAEQPNEDQGIYEGDQQVLEETPQQQGQEEQQGGQMFQ